MTQRRSPLMAAALLHKVGADPALIGDLLEEYESRRSRLWLWRQVIAAMVVAISGRAREPQRLRRTSINLAAAPRGSAAGGLGLLAAAILLAVVAPGAWWLLAIGVAGGIGVGAVLIILSRRRELRRAGRGRHNVLLPAVLLILTI